MTAVGFEAKLFRPGHWAIWSFVIKNKNKRKDYCINNDLEKDQQISIKKKET